jgi:hypothetical protein
MGNRNDLLKSKFKSFVATYILSYYYAKSKLLFESLSTPLVRRLKATSNTRLMTLVLKRRTEEEVTLFELNCKKLAQDFALNS